MSVKDSQILPISPRNLNENALIPISKKSKEIWKRVHIRLLTSIRISNLMRNIKTYGPETITNCPDYINIDDVILRHNKLLNKTITSKDTEVLPILMFHPNRGFKIYWNLILGFSLLYTCIVTPFVLAFIESRDFDQWFIIDSILTGVFFLDVWITMNTSYYDKDSKLITERASIFINYLKGWLLVDLVACMPFDLIQFSVNPNSKRSGYNALSKLIRLKNLPRLFRLSKVLNLLKDKKAFPMLDNIYYFFSISHSGVRLLGTASMILLSLHIVACLWYFVARFYEFSPDTWIIRYGILDSSTFDIYLVCIYWALTTLTTIGYGDITPKTTGEIILAMFWMVIAIYFLSFVISSLSSMLTQNDGGRKKKLDKKLALIDMYCEENHLSRKLKIQMQRYIRESTDKKFYSFAEKQELLDDLSTGLKYEISINTNRGALRVFEILNSQEDNFIFTIIPLLQILHVESEKNVYNIGDSSSEIYFLLGGKAHYMDETMRFKVINAGSYFGDIEVMKGKAREFSVIAAEEIELWVMDRTIIRIIEEEFPEAFKNFEEAAVLREKQMIQSLAEMRSIKFYGPGEIDAKQIRQAISKEYQKVLKEKIGKSGNKIERLENKIGKCKEILEKNHEILTRIEGLVIRIACVENK